jgi:hypothetical protein
MQPFRQTAREAPQKAERAAPMREPRPAKAAAAPRPPKPGKPGKPGKLPKRFEKKAKPSPGMEGRTRADGAPRLGKRGRVA